MFGISGWELIFILIIVLLVVGPNDIPKLLRGLGRIVANLRRFSDAFQKAVQDTIQEVELDELEKRMKTQVDDLTKLEKDS